MDAVSRPRWTPGAAVDLSILHRPVTVERLKKALDLAAQYQTRGYYGPAVYDRLLDCCRIAVARNERGELVALEPGPFVGHNATPPTTAPSTPPTPLTPSTPPMDDDTIDDDDPMWDDIDFSGNADEESSLSADPIGAGDATSSATPVDAGDAFLSATPINAGDASSSATPIDAGDASSSATPTQGPFAPRRSARFAWQSALSFGQGMSAQ